MRLPHNASNNALMGWIRMVDEPEADEPSLVGEPVTQSRSTAVRVCSLPIRH